MSSDAACGLADGGLPAGSRRALAALCGVAASLVLIVLAWHANVDVRRQGDIQAAADVAVGVVFLVAGTLSMSPRRQRLLVAAVGISWLVASLGPVAGAHRSVLLVMLLAFPRGRIGPAGLPLAILAAPMALGLLGLAGDALVFAATAAIRWPRGDQREDGAWPWYPTASAAAIAGALLTAEAITRTDPSALEAVLVAYLTVLAAIAAGHPMAARGAERTVRARLDRLITQVASEEGRDALARVAPLLARAVGDPALEVRRTDPGAVLATGPQPGLLLIHEAGQPVAVVKSRAVGDPDTADAVARVIRVIVATDRVQAAQARELAALEAARIRIMAADDRQRSEVAAEIRDSVLPFLDRATATIEGVMHASASPPDPALAVAHDEIRTATGELLDLVEGVPPSDLGAGDLAGALTALSARSPVPAHVRGQVAGTVDPAVARTLFYVCSEALANVIKHAEADHVDLDLSQTEGQVVIFVRDDGRGGAQASGSGLSGLAERVTALGGTLTISSPPGGGTALRAMLPLGSAGPQGAAERAGPRRTQADDSQDREGAPENAIDDAAPPRGAGTRPNPAAEPDPLRFGAALMTAALLGGTVAVLLSISMVRTQRGVRSSLLDLSLLAPLLLTALAVCVGVAFAWWDRRARVRDGLVLVGAGALVPFWSVAPWMPPVAGAAALGAAPLVIPGAWEVATGWATAPTRQVTRRALLGLTGAAVVVHLVGYDPFTDPSCLLTCDDVTPVGRALMTSRMAVTVSCGLAIFAAAVAVSGLTGSRFPIRAPRVARTTALAAIALGGAAAGGRVVAWSAPSAALPATLLLLSGAAAAMGVLVVAGQLLVRRRRLRHLVDELSALDPSTDQMRHDAQFRLPDGNGWVDAEGNDVPAQAMPGSPAGTLVPLGSEVRLLVPGSPDTGILPRLSSADLLALSNARTAAVTRAHQRLVRESQARVVLRSDAERRRIERDLHDGAQQRLVGAKLHLRITRSTVPVEVWSHLEHAEQYLQDAVEALREISHGVFPRLLETEGLVPALADLAAASAAPVRFAARPGSIAAPRDVAMATYRLVDTMVHSVRSSAGTVDVDLFTSAGVLGLRASAAHPDPAVLEAGLVDCADRVGALAGRIDIQRSDAAFLVTAEIPCAW